MPDHALPRTVDHDRRAARPSPPARVATIPAEPVPTPAPVTAAGAARPADLLRLQRLAGNAAVAAALRPPRVAPAPPPRRAAPPPTRPAPPAGPPVAAHAPVARAGVPAPPEGIAATASAPVGASATVQRGLLDDVAGAAADAAGGVRDSALQTVRDFARRMPGYELLCTILARDPVTGQAVPRTAAAIIDGFLGLVPRGEALRQQLRDSGAVERAGAWFEQEIPRLGLTWETIRGLFSRAWDALSVTDLLDPAGAWARLSTIFGPPLARIRDFATGAVTQVAEFVFEGAMTAAGGAGAQVMGIVRRAGDVFQTILRDPIGFAGNLVSAVRGGLGQFMTNIGQHLRTGLIGWLTGALGGIVRMPARFDLRGILGMALDLLGLTWANLRGRIVGVVGERAMSGIERTVEIIGEVRERGLSALTARIAQFTSGLVETVLGGIRDWVANSVVGAAITKLVSMFNPAGAVIQAIIAVYNTVQFFIERAQQLGALANAVFDSISAIASGALGNAMTAVENALGRTVPVVLGFLSRLIGLGDIAAPVRNIVQRVRTVIDGALDRVVGWVAGLARRIGGLFRRGGRADAAGSAPTAPASAGDAVKAEAARRMSAAAARGLSPAQLEDERVRVLAALRPAGLHGLVLEPGEGDVLVLKGEASPLTELMRYQRPRVACLLTATIQMREGDATAGVRTRFGSQLARDEQGRFVDADGNPVASAADAARLPTPGAMNPISPHSPRVPGTAAPQGQLRAGGVVYPSTEPGQLRVATFNTAERNHTVDSNLTHAERQLGQWFAEETSGTWRSRVGRVEIHQTLSPCTSCTRDLVEIARSTGLPRQHLILTWDQIYVGRGSNAQYSTTPDSLRQLQQHWTTPGVPDVPPPTYVPASGS